MANKNVYLGKVVKDVRKKGLDTLTEVEAICKAIINDFKKRKITYRTAMSRLNLLSLIITKSKNFKGLKEKNAKKIINKYRKMLKSSKI
jgi:hypothetical protein